MLGVQTGVMTLAGRPVAMAAQEDQLAVVWHVAMPAAEGDQALHYSVYSVSAQSELHTGALYLSGSSHLAWLGFSETGLLAAYDTQVRHNCKSLPMQWTYSGEATQGGQGRLASQPCVTNTH